MILINLLPPELRKARRTGVNPVILATAAGVLIVLGMASTWVWVRYTRIPLAEEKIVGLDADLAIAQAKAAGVVKAEAEIANFEKLHETITGLITRKMFWARTLDDYCNMLAMTNGNQWSMPGYEVRCNGLSINSAPAQAVSRDRKAVAAVSFSFRAQFRIVGEERDKAGDYLRSFFASVDQSRFWKDDGFEGRSEDTYRGDNPTWSSDIERVVTDLSFEWRRNKLIAGAQP